jgi:hypothetical protein
VQRRLSMRVEVDCDVLTMELHRVHDISNPRAAARANLK